MVTNRNWDYTEWNKNSNWEQNQPIQGTAASLLLLWVTILPYKRGFCYFSLSMLLEKSCFLSLLREDFVPQLDCAAVLHEFRQSVDLIKQAAEQYTEVTHTPSAL